MSTKPVEIFKGATLVMNYEFTAPNGVSPSLVGVTVAASAKESDGTVITLTPTNINTALGTFDIIANTTTWDVGRYKIICTFTAGTVVTIPDPVYVQIVQAP
jgi:hypothetical protein